MHQTLSPGYTSAETKDCKKHYFFWQPKMGGGYTPGCYTPGGYTSGITVPNIFRFEIFTLGYSALIRDGS